jgi:hypothetical protein
MPKRSAQDQIKHYEEKIRKLQDKSTRSYRRLRIIESDSDSEEQNEGKCYICISIVLLTHSTWFSETFRHKWCLFCYSTVFILGLFFAATSTNGAVF